MGSVDAAGSCGSNAGIFIGIGRRVVDIWYAHYCMVGCRLLVSFGSLCVPMCALRIVLVVLTLVDL
eukprot:scaffold52005_cov28-Attheya_sp.AAC.1